MLAYAAGRPTVAGRRQSPNAMLVIIGAHVALLAAVMSAKMDLSSKIARQPLVIDFIPAPRPPDPARIEPGTPRQPTQSTLDRADPIVPTPLPDRPVADATPSLPDIRDLIGPKVEPQPKVDPIPNPPAKAEARLLTPPSELKPPYPASKLASEEEAVLRLRLTIDERGRVVAVEPLGAADPAFLSAARRHLLARWRYGPASEGGRVVASTAVITLRFEING